MYIAKVIYYNLNVAEVLDSDFKNALLGIFNLTVGILLGNSVLKYLAAWLTRDNQNLGWTAAQTFPIMALMSVSKNMKL